MPQASVAIFADLLRQRRLAAGLSRRRLPMIIDPMLLRMR